MSVLRTKPVEPLPSVRTADGIVLVVRKVIGSMVYLHSRTLPVMAIQYSNAFEPYGLLFFEEPCGAEDMWATIQLSSRPKNVIATGGCAVGRHQFHEVFEKPDRLRLW